MIKQAVGAARSQRAASEKGPAPLHVHIASSGAKVMLLPGHFRDAAYVRRHVSYVVKMGAERGEQHIQCNLWTIRCNLEEMGVDPAAIDAEVRLIEGAVRRELWRQILTPDGST